MKWCPNPKGCGNAIYRDEGMTINKVVCDKCQYEFCYECGEEVCMFRPFSLLPHSFLSIYPLVSTRVHFSSLFSCILSLAPFSLAPFSLFPVSFFFPTFCSITLAHARSLNDGRLRMRKLTKNLRNFSRARMSESVQNAK